MTLTEKILARASGKARVEAADNIWVKADVLMTHDVWRAGHIGVFKNVSSQRKPKLWDKTASSSFPITTFSPRSKFEFVNVIFSAIRKEQGIPYFYDVIDDPDGHWVYDPAKGNLRSNTARTTPALHTALPQKGHRAGDEIFVRHHSHTCMAGAFNQFATGIGTPTPLRHGTGKLLIKVPETMHFRLEGKLSRVSWRRTSSCIASARSVSTVPRIARCSSTGPAWPA